MNRDIIAYYNYRAAEYDKVYLNPAEQGDLLEAKKFFQDIFYKKDILEIACGTGYWTERIAKVATSVYATDINESAIEIAAKKQVGDNVTFAVADMYSFVADKKFDAVFGGFIWSHILLQELDSFIKRMTDCLKPGGILVFTDSRQKESSGHGIQSITETDMHGNTWQARKLADGSSHLVLKNFPDKDFIMEKLSGVATQSNYIDLEHYWIAYCKLKKTFGYEKNS